MGKATDAAKAAAAKAAADAAKKAGVGAASTPAFDLVAAMKAYQAANGNTGTTGMAYKFTDAEGNKVVQDMYNQLLGRNAFGNEYNRALKLVMAQDPYTGAQGRAQVVEDLIQNTPEYQARTQNSYLDAIYNKLQSDIARTRQ